MHLDAVHNGLVAAQAADYVTRLAAPDEHTAVVGTKPNINLMVHFFTSGVTQTTHC